MLPKPCANTRKPAMQVELKSCPFCGGEAEIHDATRILGLWRLVHRCKVIGYIGIERADKEAAIAAWNTRVGDTNV